MAIKQMNYTTKSNKKKLYVFLFYKNSMYLQLKYYSWPMKLYLLNLIKYIISKLMKTFMITFKIYILITFLNMPNSKLYYKTKIYLIIKINKYL